MGIEKTEAGKEADADRNGLPTDRKKIADLEMLVKECEEAKGSWGLVQNDIVFAVVFWAMIECGFESLGNKSVDDKSELLKNSVPRHSALLSLTSDWFCF